MPLLDVHSLCLSFGERVLFDNLSFTVENRDRVGFVGSNGVGKTTLFKIIKNMITADSGSISIASGCKIGYMEQHVFADSDKSLYFEVLDVFSDLLQTEEKLKKIEEDIEEQNSDLDKLILLQHNLREKYEQNEGLTFRAKTRSMLLGLGFSEDELNLSVSSLSGGQKTRAMLAKLLLSHADFLLLDEPTNHLDIESCAFLENYLSAFNGTFIVISHDRYFLDKVTNKTLELTGGKVFAYNGNFSDSRKEKQARIELEEKHFKNQMHEIKRIEGIIQQQKRWNREKNIKTAESKQKQVDRLKAELTVVEKEDAKIDFSFSPSSNTGNDVLTLKSVEFGFSSPLFSDVSFEIKKGDVMFLLGSNGCGKTTLFNLVNGTLLPQKGDIKKGSGVKIAKYDQNLEGLDPEKTVIDDVWDAFPRLTETEIRSALAAFLFRGDDVFKEIKTLSGGEKARVSLLKVIMSKPNLLLLDEPTNHLDIASKDALEKALSNFGGTMFIISHDRYFINSFATRICHMQDKRVMTYNGNYDYFMEKRLPQSVVCSPAEKKSNDYKAEKELKGLKRSLENKIKKCEEDIYVLEEEISILEEELSVCGSDYVRAMELNEKIASKKAINEKLYCDWEEFSDKFSQIEI